MLSSTVLYLIRYFDFDVFWNGNKSIPGKNDLGDGTNQKENVNKIHNYTISLLFFPSNTECIATKRRDNESQATISWNGGG